MDPISGVRRLSSFWLWGLLLLLLLLLGRQMLTAAEFTGPEHRQRLADRQFKQRLEPGLRENVKREIGSLCKDVAEAVTLSTDQRTALETKLQPVVNQVLEAWQMAMDIHFQTMPTVEEAESTIFLGDALVQPEVTAADVKGMQLWDSILKAELGEEAFARWKVREKELRAEHAKANEAAITKQVAQAAKSKVIQWQSQIKRVAKTLDWEEVTTRPLMDLATTTAQRFEKGFSERMREIAPKENELLLGCSTDAQAELRNRPIRTLYPPRMRLLQEETQHIIDEAITQRLSTEDKKKMELEEAKLQTRITAAAKETVKQQLNQQVTQLNLTSSARLPQLLELLQLPSPTAKALEKQMMDGETAAKAVWTRALEAHAVKSLENMVKSRDADEVISSVEKGHWRWPNEAADRQLALENQRLWRTALKTHLTAEQTEQWLRHERQQQERKASALTKLAVSEVDLKVRLQAVQRRDLETALRPVAEQVARIPGGVKSGLSWSSLDGSLMLLEGLEPGTLEKLLTPAQRQRLEDQSSRYRAYWHAAQTKIELLQEEKP